MTALFLLSLVGTTLIIVRGTIFRWLRAVQPTFFGCSQCMGFWIGAAAGAIGLIVTGRGRVTDAFVVGTATSFLSLFFDAVLLHLLGNPSEESS